MTAQEVIKSFVKQLANHGYASSDSIAVNMLDSAVRASSRYESIQDVIDAFKADQVKAEMEAVEEVLGSDYAGKTMSDLSDDILDADAKDYDTDNKSNAYYDEDNDSRSTVENFIKERMSDIFLEKYCGIILNEKFFFNSSGSVRSWNKETSNIDTGAITGSDAGTDTTKTKSSVVPEEFINTYTATTTAAQNIITNDRNWGVAATSASDTITSNGADSISAGAGNDSITANANGATISSGDGSDFITISESVNDITLSDLNEYDTLTISGDFEVGSAQIEDSLLVVTDRTGTRKIRFGDFETAKLAKINSTTIANWLSLSGVSLNTLNTKNYVDKALESSNVSNSAITVDLSTVDTSKIGNVTLNGSVVGSLSSTFPNASTFTRNGLTIHLLGVSSDTSGSTSNITVKTLDELTDAQRTIVAGLFKWWVQGGLTLSEESYGISFNSSTATVKDMGLFFYDGQGSNYTLAAAPYWPRSSDGGITKLMLKINMNYYSSIDAEDMDGTTSSVKNLLDRTLAHELTHSNMETNINFFNKLPQFIVEGSAELTHGIDDERGNRIFNIAADTSSISTVLDVTNTDTGDANYYAGGYMFLRYFAKTAAAQTLPAFGEISATVNPNSGTYYISGNKTSETASNTAQDIELGTVSNGVYTVENTGVHQIINNTSNLKIAGLTVNDTLIGSSSVDLVTTAEGSFITSGNGRDSINLYGQFATIDAGADNDTVIAQDGNHHFIELGDGNDFVEFKLTNVYDNTITGGAGNDSILLLGSYNASIDMGAGDDSIYFGGHSNTIYAGDGNDILKPRYTNDGENFIELGAGDDRATVYGASNTLDGGNGSDYIYLHSGATNTVFKYKSGDGYDTIDGFNSTSTLIIGGGLGTYETVASRRDIVVTVDDGAITLRNVATLSTINIDGKEKTPLLIEGTADPDNLSNTLDGATVLAYAGDDTISNSGSQVSIDGGDDNDLISLSGAGATVDVGAGDDTISFATNVTGFDVEGFGAGDVIQLNLSLDALETISGGIIAGDVTIGGLDLSTTSAGWSISDTVATHETKISAGATLSDDSKSIVYGAASSESVTVGGVGSTDGLDIDTANKIVTVEASALNGMDVTISDGYKLELGDVAAPSMTAAAWSLSGTAATYKASATIAGYTLEDNQIIYTAASGGNILVTVGGVGSTSGLDIDTANKVVTVKAAALNETDVTISDGYKLALGSDVATSTAIGAAWSLSGTTAIYKSSGTTAGYTLDNNRITYTAASDKETLIELGGIASAPTVKGNAVKLKPKNFAGNVSVISGGYSFNLNGGNYAGKTFSGNDDANNITSDGRSITLAGGAGNDTLTGGNDENYLSGEDGNDLLIGGAGVDTFDYSGGNDTISNYASKDKITTSSAHENFSVNGSDVVFIFGDGFLTIQDSAGKAINLNSNVNCYTADGIYDKKKKSVTLLATTKNFTADSKLVTIDGTAANAIEIIGNNKANKIYAGTGGATITGGKGKDTIYGGAGADIFCYDKGDGKDVIEGSGADDMISLGSDAAIKDVKIKSGDTVIKIGSGSLTVKDTTEFKFMQDGDEMIFSAGVFIADETAKVYGSFKGTVDLAEYDAKNFDGTLARKKLTIIGTDSANSLVGGKGKDSLSGGAGDDTLWGGKGKDTLWGGDGSDTFIFHAGDGTDVIADYEAGDLLQILNKRGTASADFRKATFKGSTLTLNVTGGGKVILDNVTSSSTFNINGDNYHISDQTLTKD